MQFNALILHATLGVQVMQTDPSFKIFIGQLERATDLFVQEKKKLEGKAVEKRG